MRDGLREMQPCPRAPGCVRSTDSLPFAPATSSRQVRALKRWTAACTDGPRQAGEGKSSSDKLEFSVVRLVFLEVIGGHKFKGENGTDNS